MPAGKAIALAAMPTAVLMGMGFTPTLALADGNDSAKPTSNSLTADEYKDCVAALEDAEKGTSGVAHAVALGDRRGRRRQGRRDGARPLGNRQGHGHR